MDELIGGSRSVYPAEGPRQILLYYPYRDHVPVLNRGKKPIFGQGRDSKDHDGP